MCSVADPCGGVLYADERFNRDASASGLRVRRAQCLNAHSFILGPPPALRGHIAAWPPVRCCRGCGEPLGPDEPRVKHFRCLSLELQHKILRRTTR